MATTTRAGGRLRVTLPASLQIGDEGTVARPSSSVRSRRGSGLRSAEAAAAPQDQASMDSALLTVLQAQQLELVDAVPVAPAPTRRRRSGAQAGAAPSATATFAVDVAAQEDAVILVEQDGMYSWVLPRSVETKEPRRQRNARTVAATRTVTFEITLGAGTRPPGAARRNMITEFVVGEAKAYVLKFVARVAVKGAMAFLERNVRRGLLHLTADELTSWQPLTDPHALQLPADRPPRLLLFVHGTFSSTVGGFYALSLTPWGQEFLKAAREHYDAVIGFDHPTLSVDPFANASDLLALLEALPWETPPSIDIISHSRGGLVVRSLVEQLLPRVPTPVQINRAIFVAATNSGTTLAKTENWNQLLDLYTNLAAVTLKIIALLPQAKPAAELLNEVIQGLGAFIKYVAAGALDDGDVPGLAAMVPDGPFITDLNLAQPGQPTVATSYYCVVSSEFQSQQALAEGLAELPTKLLAWAADSLADALLGEPNDLVVDIASMSAIDPAHGLFVKDTLAYGPNAKVYHTNYFLQPAVVGAFVRWLAVPPPASATPQRAGGVVRAVSLPEAVASALPAAVSTDILPISATTSLREALEQIQQAAPSYVVINRRWGGRMLSYARSPREIYTRYRKMQQQGGVHEGVDLITALELRESDASKVETSERISEYLGGARRASGRGTAITTSAGPRRNRATVVRTGEQPVGVLPPTRATATPLDLSELAALANAGPAPLATAGPPPSTYTPELAARVEHTTVMPTYSAAAAPPPSAPAAPETALCHFLAEMEAETRAGWTTTVEVTLSREQLEHAESATSQGGSGEVDTSRKLVVLVQPRKNFTFKDEDGPDDPGRAEVDPPEPGNPVVCQFDLRATDVGEGEVRVVIRQRQTALATFTLRPQVVTRRTGAATRLVDQGTLHEAPPLESRLIQLEIYQRINGSETRYEFRLDAPGVGPGLNRRVLSDPLKVDQQSYVRKRYQDIEDRWVRNKADARNFLADLRSIGVEMFKELIPKDLREELWEYRDQLTSIQIQSDEPFIPWELVHLTPPDGKMPRDPHFLGQMGVVRWLDNIPWGPKLIKVRRGRARSVIPVYPPPNRLPEAEKEFEFLEKQFGARPVQPPRPGDVRDLLHAGDFDLLHFACHGLADMGEFVDAQLELMGDHGSEPFSATTVKAWANLDQGDSRPMIVLNACQVGRASYSLTGIGGFAQAFLAAGAGAFVGTLWSVGDSPARTFTERMYTELLKGATLSQASIAGREAARSAGDATWLAYVVYGHPHMRISKT